MKWDVFFMKEWRVYTVFVDLGENVIFLYGIIVRIQRDIFKGIIKLDFSRVDKKTLAGNYTCVFGWMVFQYFCLRIRIILVFYPINAQSYRKYASPLKLYALW